MKGKGYDKGNSFLRFTTFSPNSTKFNASRNWQLTLLILVINNYDPVLCQARPWKYSWINRNPATTAQVGHVCKFAY